MRFTSFGANRTEGITAHALPPLKQFLERFQDARVNASRKNLEPFQTAQFQMEPFHFLSCKQGLKHYVRKLFWGIAPLAPSVNGPAQLTYFHRIIALYCTARNLVYF